MRNAPRVLLVVEKDAAWLRLAELLRNEGYAVVTTANGFRAIPKLETFSPDVLITPFNALGLGGIELLNRAHSGGRDCAGLIVVREGATRDVVEAMRGGAALCLPEPLDYQRVSHALAGLPKSGRRHPRRRKVESRSPMPRVDGLLGESTMMQSLRDSVLTLAPSRATVLITGENGTGKGLVARAVHQHSSRAQGPFVPLQCSSLPETLLESELFGHVRGAFTGAVSARVGRLEGARGGTLFLDEIGEISPSTQIKLLRFLQDHELEPVGSNHVVKVDARIVAATNCDLAQRVRAGTFREDVFFRLNVAAIEVPPLRAHADDIPLLATHFLERFAQQEHRDVHGIEDHALQQLYRYPWPGNVRELENVVERAVVLAEGPVVSLEDLPEAVRVATPRARHCPTVPGATLAEIEQWAILQTYAHAQGSTSKAASLLGISARTVQYRMSRYRRSGTDAPALVAAAGD